MAELHSTMTPVVPSTTTMPSGESRKTASSIAVRPADVRAAPLADSGCGTDGTSGGRLLVVTEDVRGVSYGGLGPKARLTKQSPCPQAAHYLRAATACAGVRSMTLLAISVAFSRVGSPATKLWATGRDGRHAFLPSIVSGRKRR